MALLTSTIVLFGCVDDGPIGPSEPSEPRPSISDGAHGGNPYFYWLPPLRANPRSRGEFNGTLSPAVEICEWSGSGAWSEADCVVRARLTRSGSEPAGAPLLVVEGNHYHADWNTRLFEVDLEKLYRLRVLLGNRELGHLDVVFGSKGREAKQKASAGTVGVVLGRTVPVKFRIFSGALCWPDPACEEALASGELLETTLTPDGGTFIVPSGHAGVQFEQGAVSEDVTLLIFRNDVENAQQCLPTPLRQFEGCYNFSTIPRVDQFATPAVLGFCVDDAAEPVESQLQIHQFDPDNPEDGVRALENVALPFQLTCDDFIAFVEPSGGFAKLAFDAVMRPLAELFAVSHAHAGDLGIGGLTSSFSDFGWVQSASIQIVEGDGQTAAVGATLSLAPKVRLVTSHPAGAPVEPIPGVDLIFTYKDPAGLTVGTPVTVATDANGYASAPWVLGAAPGTYSLEVSLAPISGVEHSDIAPAVFTATGTVAGQTLSGTIYYSTTGLAGVTVELRPGSATNPPTQSTTTDANGGYSFANVGPGTYHVRGYGPTAEYITWKSTSVTVGSIDVTQDLQLPKDILLQSPVNGGSAGIHPWLAWTANPEAASYTVQLNRTSDWFLVEQKTGLTTTSYSVVPTLTVGTNYTWQVDAYDSGNRHVGSTEQSFTFTVANSNLFLEQVVLSSTTVTIGGPSVPYTARMRNDSGANASVVVLQGWIEQGTARRAAAGAQVTCVSTTGVLPPGVCEDSWVLVASNDTAGTGTLVAGAATAVIELKLDANVVDEVWIPITLTN